MRSFTVFAAFVAAAASTALIGGAPAGAASSSASSTGMSSAGSSSAAQTDYVVLQDAAGSTSAAVAAVRAAGGTVVSSNPALGYVIARSASPRFASAVGASPAVVGAARDRVIGKAPDDQRASKFAIERLRGQAASQAAKGKGSAGKGSAGKGAEPLAGQQWDMRQIGATPAGSYAVQKGSKKVLVGIIDTGIDGTHPDIAKNFDAKLSRNFVTDIPDIDGPCEHPSCVDPANEDDDGHGTHVASTIGAPINGIGIAGVAPDVTLVNIRAGQDSGFFFLEPTLKALTYAGDIGVDVVNMSYYTDPWLYNCLDNPADSPAEQQEQRVIRVATQRALNYARGHGVLPVSAEGNEATDLNNPTSDDTSPDYPVDTAHPRTVDNSCLNVPAESNGVVTVSATGPSTRKSYYSNYGTQETDIAAPGGDAYDTPDGHRDITGAVLAAMPANVAQASGVLNPDGTPNTESVVQDCKGSTCGYYQYLQGTSMASPHAAGVAALIVSEYGGKDRAAKGLTLAPSKTQAILFATATKHACPDPRTYHYHRVLVSGAVVDSEATCEGGRQDNGFYGHGIVNALTAVS